MSSLTEQLTLGVVLEGRVVKVEGTLRISYRNVSILDELEVLQPFLDRMRDSALRIITYQTEISYLLKVVKVGTTERVSYHTFKKRVSLAKRIKSGL